MATIYQTTFFFNHCTKRSYSLSHLILAPTLKGGPINTPLQTRLGEVQEAAQVCKMAEPGFEAGNVWYENLGLQSHREKSMRTGVPPRAFMPSTWQMEEGWAFQVGSQSGRGVLSFES